MNSPPPPRKRYLEPGDWVVLAVTGAYITPALALSFSRQNMEFVLYVVVLGVLVGAMLTLHHYVRLHLAALWGLSLWGLAHLCGGLAQIPANWPVTPGNTHVLYNLWLIPHALKYDQLVHAYGFALTTWICWQALQRAFSNRGVDVAPSFGLLTLCAAAGMGFGALNEVVEFMAVLTIPHTNVGGYVNTGWDLVSNFVGAVIGAGLIALLQPRPPAGTSPPGPTPSR